MLGIEWQDEEQIVESTFRKNGIVDGVLRYRHIRELDDYPGGKDRHYLFFHRQGPYVKGELIEKSFATSGETIGYASEHLQNSRQCFWECAAPREPFQEPKHWDIGESIAHLSVLACEEELMHKQRGDGFLEALLSDCLEWTGDDQFSPFERLGQTPAPSLPTFRDVLPTHRTYRPRHSKAWLKSEESRAFARLAEGLEVFFRELYTCLHSLSGNRRQSERVPSQCANKYIIPLF